MDILRADLNLGDFNDATKASHETTDCSGYTEALQPSNPSAEQPAIAGALVEAGAPGIGEHKPCSSTPRIFSSDNSFPGDKKRNRTRIEVEGSESDRNSHLSRSRCHGLAGQLIDLTSDNDKSDDEIMDGDDLQNSVARNEATKRPRVQNQRFKAQPQNLPQQTSASSTQNNRTGLATVLRGRLGIPAFAGRGAATSDLVPVDLAGEDTSCSSELEKGGSSSDSDVSEDDVGFIPLLKAKQQATVEAVGAPAPGVDSSTRASAARRGGGSEPHTSLSKHRLAKTNTLRELGTLLQQEPKQGSAPSRLWPSASRFYRTVLRWKFCPGRFTITEDLQSATRTVDLPAVPTEFDGVVRYQAVLSRLLMKETIASLQKDLSEKYGRGRPVEIAGKMKSTFVVEEDTHTSSDIKDGKLYCIQAKLQIPVDDNDRDEDRQPPLSGGDLICIRSPGWSDQSKDSILGVVQSWYPIYENTSNRRVGGEGASFLRILLCAHATGGDGIGGSGGWISVANIQATSCRGADVYIMKVGSVVTASREFQAVMSISDFPERIRRCLLKPSVGKEGRGVGQSSSSSSSLPITATSIAERTNTASGGGERGSGSSLAERGKGGAGGDLLYVPPKNVPVELWKAVMDSFNRSQVLAIRQVAEGSSAGFTLLQGPPGTGKTRTIMGIVGVLLAGGCSHPTCSEIAPSGKGDDRRRNKKSGAGIVVGSSLNASSSQDGKHKKQDQGKSKGTGGARISAPQGSRRVRVLVVAPSNAAVDELVLRLCQGGVPGAKGRPFFPKVVRVGGPREKLEEEGGSAVPGVEGRDVYSVHQASSSVVQSVSLERLTEELQKKAKGPVQFSRLHVLLEADVVCATLSGSGSLQLIEAMLLSEQGTTKAGKQVTKKQQKRMNQIASSNAGSTSLTFDAIVMDEAAQAVEPASLIPLRFNPRAIVLVGDPAQLPATIFSREAQNANYDQSLFQRLQRGGHPKMMLDTQYRMHPSIASFAGSRFYNGLLRSAHTVTEESHSQPFHKLPRFAPYLFHNVSSGRLTRGGGRGSSSSVSFSNMEEVYYITALLSDLVTTFPDTDFNGRVGVIAPYRNQIQALKRAMWSTGLRQDGVEVSTVDGFQGREKEIMIFSCVRAPDKPAPQGPHGERSGVGFLDDWRRLNVAITRAKYAMWIVGHAGFLRQSVEWKELINDSRQRGAFVDRASGISASADSRSGRGKEEESRTSTSNPAESPAATGGATDDGFAGKRAENTPIARYSGPRGRKNVPVARYSGPRGNMPVARYSGVGGKPSGMAAHGYAPPGGAPSYGSGAHGVPPSLHPHPHIPAGGPTATNSGQYKNLYSGQHQHGRGGRGFDYSRLGGPPIRPRFRGQPQPRTDHADSRRSEMGSPRRGGSSVFLHDLPIAQPSKRSLPASQQPQSVVVTTKNSGTDYSRRAGNALLDGLPLAPPMIGRSPETSKPGL